MCVLMGVFKAYVQKFKINILHNLLSQYGGLNCIHFINDIICEVIYNDYNYNFVDNGIFPDFLKTANVKPVFKKVHELIKKLQAS